MGHDPFALIGRVVADKYSVDELLGEGGYGVVYGGRHLLLNESVAIKCMKPLGATVEDQARATELFLREARVLFNLSHPGIVRMYDVGTLRDEGRNPPYVVLERLRGQSFEDLIKSGRANFERAEIEWMFERILEALAFAHEHGVVHRDLKPSNLMLVGDPSGTLTAGKVKVLDFGVARWANEQRPPSGLTGFTPAYAAPEQWDDDLSLVGPPSDVFALGVILAEICTLNPVFAHSSPARILRAVIDPARRIEVLGMRPDLPEGLDGLLARATDIDPEMRHADAGALLEDFRVVFGLRSATSSARAQVRSSGTPADKPPASALATAATERAPASLRRRAAEPAADTERSWPVADAVEAAPSRLKAPQRPLWPVIAAATLFAGGGAAMLVRATNSDSPATSASNGPPAPLEIASAVAPASASAASHFAAARVVPRAFSPGEHYSAEQIDKALAAETASLDACYRTALETNDRLSGRGIMLVALEASGHVFDLAPLDEATWVDNIVRDESLRICVRERIKRWVFPPHGKADLAALVVILHYQPAASDVPPIARELIGRFTSRFHNKKTGEAYDPTDATLTRDHDVAALEYPDGALGCAIFPEDKSLTCRWIQTDYRGNAGLTPDKHGGYQGSWGYYPSDSDGGAWTLEPKRR